MDETSNCGGGISDRDHRQKRSYIHRSHGTLVLLASISIALVLGAAIIFISAPSGVPAQADRGLLIPSLDGKHGLIAFLSRPQQKSRQLPSSCCMVAAGLHLRPTRSLSTVI